MSDQRRHRSIIYFSESGPGLSANLIRNDVQHSAPVPRVRWRTVVLLILAVLALRIAYLWLFNSWELAADEAHYWEWSRRPDWSYYTKGPGVAWVIWLSTHLVGVSAAAVRLPSAIASALMTLAGARLSLDITKGNGRAAWNAAIALMITPAYFVLAQLMTTDCFWSAGWVISTWLVFLATRPGATPSARWSAWTAAGFAIGLTVLFKYTALFFVPGVALFLLVRRRQLVWDRATLFGVLSSLIAMCVACLPIIIWNASRGWPTVAHQVGRIRLPGGDESVDWSWSPEWFLVFAGAQIALLGVVGVALIIFAILQERQRRRIDPPDVTRQIGIALLTYVSVPLLVFYFLLSVARETQGNWAVAGYSTWMILVGISVTDALQHRRELVDRWKQSPEPRPRMGLLNRSPTTPFQIAWHWFIAVGTFAAIVIVLGPRLLLMEPFKSNQRIQHLTARVYGAQNHALAVDAIAQANITPDGTPPLVIANRYQEASLLAFYMPGHPLVYSAASHLGARPNAYDFFADTNLDDPKMHGRRVLLLGASANEWRTAFNIEKLIAVDGQKNVFLAEGYAGLKRGTQEIRAHE